MAMSIYASSKFENTLSEEEAAQINALINKYSKDDEVEQYVQTGIGFSGESFDFGGTVNKGVTEISGSAALPLDEAQILLALDHWLALVTEIRLALDKGDWHVHLGDWDVEWDSASQRYAIEI